MQYTIPWPDKDSLIQLFSIMDYFFGADRELRPAFAELQQQTVVSRLAGQGTTRSSHLPVATQFGEAWEVSAKCGARIL